MKVSPTGAPAWTSSKPPLLRFLNACHAEYLAETSGAVADYIPELGKADPAHFGISLATLDGHVYEVGDTKVPFHHPVDVKTLRVRAGAGHAGRRAGRKRDRRRAVGRSLQFDPPQRREPSVQSDGECRRDRLLRADLRSQGRRRVRIYQAGAGTVCRTRARRRRRRLFIREPDRRPQPGDRLSPAHQRRHQGQCQRRCWRSISGNARSW